MKPRKSVDVVERPRCSTMMRVCSSGLARSLVMVAVDDHSCKPSHMSRA